MNLMRNFFQIANSWQGEVYFRVSKHLNIPVSEVIRAKFNPDIKFLIFKYHQQLVFEKREAEEIHKMQSEVNSRG